MVAIGFIAVWSILSNVLCSLMLIMHRSFRIGDDIEVVAINEVLADAPETVNQDAYGDGWLVQVRLSDASQLDDLLDAEGYGEALEAEDH